MSCEKTVQDSPLASGDFLAIFSVLWLAEALPWPLSQYSYGALLCACLPLNVSLYNKDMGHIGLVLTVRT